MTASGGETFSWPDRKSSISYSERVSELERELVSAQRVAGLPVSLPYTRAISPPIILKKSLVRFFRNQITLKVYFVLAFVTALTLLNFELRISFICLFMSNIEPFRYCFRY